MLRDLHLNALYFKSPASKLSELLWTSKFTRAQINGSIGHGKNKTNFKDFTFSKIASCYIRRTEVSNSRFLFYELYLLRKRGGELTEKGDHSNNKQ